MNEASATNNLRSQTEHKKNYAGEEDATRLEHFKASLQRINEHNAKFAKGETTYKQGLNKMSDWTPEEKKSQLGLNPAPENTDQWKAYKVNT